MRRASGERSTNVELSRNAQLKRLCLQVSCAVAGALHIERGDVRRIDSSAARLRCEPKHCYDDDCKGDDDDDEPRFYSDDVVDDDDDGDG